MDEQARFVGVDPVTNEVLWVCSGANAQGHCPLAEKPPYVCQGLRLVAAGGTDRDGEWLYIDKPEPGRCPARDLT
jgi:hypothetical protein